MRGEKQIYKYQKDGKTGSSPHARGKEIVLGIKTCNPRIIPACAGKRIGTSIVVVIPEDHPRMRGEKRSER